MRRQVLEGLRVTGIHEPELDGAVGHELPAVLPADFPGTQKGEEKKGGAEETKGGNEERVDPRQCTPNQAKGKGPQQGDDGEVDHGPGLRDEPLPAIGPAEGKLVTATRRARYILKIFVPRFVEGYEKFQVIDLRRIVTGGKVGI